MPESDFRCSFASVVDDEPIVGTAPTDTELLLVEAPGPWGRDAIADNRLPEVVRAHLASLDLKVFLLRRPDGSAGPGTHVFRATATPEGYDVRATVLDRHFHRFAKEGGTILLNQTARCVPMSWQSARCGWLIWETPGTG